MKTLHIAESRILEQSVVCDTLVIDQGAVVAAPEGKQLSLTVDSVHKDIFPGHYTGKIVLEVTEGFGRAGGFGPPGPPPTDFTAAIRGEGGKVVEEKSVLSAVNGGSIEGGVIEGITIISDGNRMGGLDLMDGEYTLKNVTIKMNGYGGNDFSGKGAAISVSGDARLEIDGLTIRNSGVIRSGIIGTDDAKILVKNADIVTMGGNTAQYDAAYDDVGGMLCVPWQLGLNGNCRSSSVLKKASIDYVDSKITSWGWGVLSVDGTSPSEDFDEYSIHMGAKNCEVNVIGPSGYGAFSIGPSKDVFENTVFNVPDYSLIQANETASADYIGCTVNSKRFGTMSYANQGGKLNVKDSTFNTGSATFLVKGCYPQISVENSKLNAQDGTIIQMIDCDDPNYGLTGMDLDAQVPEKIADHDVSKVNYHDFYLYNKLLCENKPTDLQATFKDMELKGNFFNAITNTCPVGTYNPNPQPVKKIPVEQLEVMIEKGLVEAPPKEEMPNFTKTPSTAYPANLVVYLVNTRYEGYMAAAVAKHEVKRSGKENYSYLGKVTNNPCPVVNNGVVLFMDEASTWTVTDTCYMSGLNLAQGAKVTGKDGKSVVMTVDGVRTKLAPGSYAGDIRIELA